MLRAPSLRAHSHCHRSEVNCAPRGFIAPFSRGMMMHRWNRAGAAVVLALAVASVAPAAFAAPHNVILFVTDGLRSQIVDEKNAPTLARLRAEGVDFRNSHSLFPTFTTANASAFATGHGLGDTGDFSNSIFTAFPVQSSGGAVTPFLENNRILREVDEHFGGNYLNEETFVSAAHASGQFSTAIIGKIGPAAIFHLRSIRESGTLLIDDSTGRDGGVALSEEWLAAIKATGLEPKSPGRGSNSDAGDSRTPGTWIPAYGLQQFFTEMAVKVVLPRFKAANKPFVLVFWARDPDGTQHNHGDSFGSLQPGVNGPTSLAAIRATDSALFAIEQSLKWLGLADTTNIVVAADHGVSTISKASKTSSSVGVTYDDVVPGELPPGFLAIDLTALLQKEDPAIRLFDTNAKNGVVDWKAGKHPRLGHGVIGKDAAAPSVVVAANGGSDLIYLPAELPKKRAQRLARRLVAALAEQDYVSGLFVDTLRFGDIPGALSLKDIGLAGSARTPVPAIVVNFTSFATDCGNSIPALCGVEIADTSLQQGQGMHGSFSRADTWNFMAARGPDFRKGFVNPMPASNADVGRTLTHLLGLNVPANGKLLGRVLDESLRDGKTAEVTSRTLESKPAVNGMKTVLKLQSVGSNVYLDAGGFPGRTLGLDAP
jgi:hypothetical protein